MRKFKIKFQNLSFNPMQNSILERNKGFNSKKKKKNLFFLLSLIVYFLNWTRQNSDPTGYEQTAKNEQKSDLSYSFNQLSCLKWLF